MKTSKQTEIVAIIEKMKSQKKVVSMETLIPLIDFKKLDLQTELLIEKHLKENAPKTKGEFISGGSIYKLQDLFLKENPNFKLVKGSKKYNEFRTIRNKCQKYVNSFFSVNVTPTKENMQTLFDFLKIHLKSPNLEKIETFVGGSKNSATYENVEIFIQKAKDRKIQFPK